jgi:hypothetical protein
MIRTAKKQDIPALIEIYSHAQEFMAENGNPTQWGYVYPPKELIEKDIKNRILYVIEKNSVVHGVFAFIKGDDPTYAEIDGGWLSNAPYSTIHRVASDGKTNGIFEECFKFCREKDGHLRIDTHKDNHIMRHIIEKSGFKYCGIIRVEDQDERMAFELIK